MSQSRSKKDPQRVSVRDVGGYCVGGDEEKHIGRHGTFAAHGLEVPMKKIIGLLGTFYPGLEELLAK